MSVGRFSRLIPVLALAVAACEKSNSAPTGTSSTTGAEAVSPLQPAPKSAAPKTAEPTWKSIEGGKECRFAGVVAEVPGTWTIVPQGNATLIVPPGANQTVLEELYGFMGEPTLKTIDAPELEPYLDQALMQLLQVPVQRQGGAEKVKVGALEGKMWKWTATAMDGRAFEVRSWGFVGSYAGSLVAIATPEAMKRRMADLEAIRGSIRKPAAAAISAARMAGTWVRAYGTGSVMIGSSTEQRITFDGSGRFHYHSEGTSHGLFHSGSTQTDVSGSWKLAGDQLTGTADSGESKTFTLEARTEASTGAAVIAIDGTEFRDAQGRPW